MDWIDLGVRFNLIGFLTVYELPNGSK